MKSTFLFLFIICSISCNPESRETQNYFDYDEVIHYKNEISESSLPELYDNQSKTVIDSLKMGVILNDIPKSITDTFFLSKMKAIGYKKTKIGKDKFQRLNQIFCEKKSSESVFSSCIYVYRDVLVFRKHSKTVGIAKICFGCKDSKIVGTKKNTGDFGQDGDYEKLQELLYK